MGFLDLATVSEENLLDLDRSTEGVVARYRFADPTGAPPEPSTALLLVRYPQAARAERALAGIADAPELSASRRLDLAIACVFGAAGRSQAEQLIEQMEPIE